MPRNIFVKLNSANNVFDDSYSMTNSDGGYVFQSVLGSALLSGVTYSVGNTQSVFRIFNDSSIVWPQLIGYVTFSNNFIGVCTATASPDKPVYSMTFSSGQVGINSALYWDALGTNPFTDSFGKVYSFATNQNSVGPFRQVRISSSSIIDVVSICGTYTPYGYYVNATQSTNVGNTDRLWGAIDDNPPYVNQFIYAASSGTYFPNGQSIAWSALPNTTSTHIIVFGANTIISSVRVL